MSMSDYFLCARIGFDYFTEKGYAPRWTGSNCINFDSGLLAMQWFGNGQVEVRYFEHTDKPVVRTRDLVSLHFHHADPCLFEQVSSILDRLREASSADTSMHD